MNKQTDVSRSLKQAMSPLITTESTASVSSSCTSASTTQSASVATLSDASSPSGASSPVQGMKGNESRGKSGAYKFKCTFKGCNKAYKYNADLRFHILSHTGEKPFKCDWPGCGKAFTRKRILKEHRNTHLGLKPNVCPLPGCGKSFSWKANLTRHIGDAHRLQARELKLMVSKRRRSESVAKRNYTRLFPAPGSSRRGRRGSAGGNAKGAQPNRVGSSRIPAVAGLQSTSQLAMRGMRQRGFSMGHQPVMMMATMRSPSHATATVANLASDGSNDAYFRRRHSADPVLPPSTPWRPLVHPTTHQKRQWQLDEQKRREHHSQQQHQQQQHQQQQHHHHQQQQHLQQLWHQQQRMFFGTPPRPTSAWGFPQGAAPVPPSRMSSAAGITLPPFLPSLTPTRRKRRATSDGSALRAPTRVAAQIASRRTRAHTASEVPPVVFSILKHTRARQSPEQIAEECRKSGATALFL